MPAFSSMSILLILSCFNFLFVFPSFADEDMHSDTLSQGQGLRDFQFLSSPNQKFRLQFFSPGVSRNRYVGVLTTPFYQDSFSVVWVANRNNPITDTSGILMIDDSTLKISHSGGNPIVLTEKFRSTNASATLLDDGNFVFGEVNSDGSIITPFWQSFDFPTHTLLPRMKLGINLETKQKWSLTSWISYDVPASGPLTLGVDPNGSSQLIMSWHGNVYWRSGPLQYGSFESLRKLANINILGFSSISNESESYLTYSVKDNQSFLRLRLDIDGWLFVDQFEGGIGYNPCPLLKALSAGCVQMIPECNKGKDHVYNGSQVFVSGYSYTSDGNYNMGIFDCGVKCEQNCSCIAYASLFDNGTGCRIWTNETTFESSEPQFAREFYVLRGQNTNFTLSQRGPHPVGQKNVNSARKRWILPVASTGGALLTLSFMLFCILRRLKTKAKMVLVDTTRTREKCCTMNDIENDIKQVRSFSFKIIAIATNNFSAANKLGEGGFGPVYKGELPDGQEVAIKRLSKSSGQGLLEFKNEILLIAKLQHNNLVKILGCCIQGQEKILVYEYMPNKSLDFFIFDPTKREILKWMDRRNVIEGIAQGLVYLHKHSRLRVIHRDLKASNILLDQNMNPKISDFGMARIFGKQQSEANTNRIVGTYGYMSPEYAIEGVVSMKTDVFSFGVLVLEIVSGKKNRGCYDPERPLNLIGYAWKLWIEGRALELMDTTLDCTNHENEVMRTINIGLLCVQDCAADRPAMVDVVSMLTNEYLQLPQPKRPAFFIETSPAQSNNEVDLEKTCTNKLSISLMEAR